MRLLQIPHELTEESGIRRVVDKYNMHLPKYGIDLVEPGQPYDIKAVHAGMTGYDCDVAHLHGLYFTADYPAPAWEYRSNQRIVDALRSAYVVTVPSEWVAEILRRDMHLDPFVIPHGVDWDEWQHGHDIENFVFAYGKNRAGQDVCDPSFLSDFARRFPDENFVATFANRDAPNNVDITGILPFSQMKRTLQSAKVYINTTKETFGITMLEALAAGTPVLAYRHGGAVDIIVHGVNGYLANPGDLDDLAHGLNYCLNHRDVLSNNARQMAKQFTWEHVCEMLVNVYETALELKDKPHDVSVVIPVYNKRPEEVERAIKSAVNQTLSPKDIVVVDDGSNDIHKPHLDDVVSRFPQVRYITQANAGVAVARNNGIAATDSRYVCCIDADDWIDPHFLEACVNELKSDRRLGLSYTGLYYHKPDGSEGLSRWPDEYNYDDQLKRKNQVPTCCVFRRDLWQRLGGYRKRYAPTGAGSEDAEFFTRMGAIGFGGKRATTAGLFHYSWMSGIVSGNPDYEEVDWLAWHPWAVHDDFHPFASMASPKKMSHPVRQYDEPHVSVIIPVGPGHEHEIVNALDSLQAQTFRGWEAIVVWDTLSDEEFDDWYYNAFPYTRNFSAYEITDDGEVISKGAGHARNVGVNHARAPFVLFLDADDWLDPKALEQMVWAWNNSNAAIYTDYIGISYVEKPSDLAQQLQRQMLKYDSSTKRAIIRYNAEEFDCEKASKQPSDDSLYLWCNVTTMIPKAWHYEVGGFDEDMPSWEDVLYWYKMAWLGKCFVRVPEPLLIYRFYSGKRRDSGVKMWSELIEYIQEQKHEFLRDKDMGCGCKGNKSTANMPQQVMAKTSGIQSLSTSGDNQMSDSDFVMVQYTHPNKGKHPVIGLATKTRYGYRAGGEQFLVHKSDIEASQYFQPVNKVMAPPQPPQIDTPPPPHIAEMQTVDEVIEEVVDDFEELEKDDTPLDEQELELSLLPGVTPQVEERLRKAGAINAAQIVSLGMEGLMGIKGIGEARAHSILSYIEEKFYS